MWTIREVIQESIYRANIVGRRQSIPDDKFEDALNILRDLAAEYSSKNLLQWLRRECYINEIGMNPESYVFGNGYEDGVNFWFIIEGNTGVLPEANYANYMAGCEGWDKNKQVFHIVAYEPSPGATAYMWQPTNHATKEEAIADLNGAIVKVIPESIKTFVTIGAVDPSLNTYDYTDTVDVVAINPDCITEVYYELNKPEVNDDFNHPLTYVSYEDFWQAGWGAYVYSWQAISDTKIALYLKKSMTDMINSKGFGLKILYNQAWKFDENTEVRAPDIYRSLFISALTYRLAVRYPRLSEEHTSRLRAELDERIRTLSSKTRANKYITRQGSRTNELVRPDQLAAGTFIFPM